MVQYKHDYRVGEYTFKDLITFDPIDYSIKIELMFPDNYHSILQKTIEHKPIVSCKLLLHNLNPRLTLSSDPELFNNIELVQFENALNQFKNYASETERVLFKGIGRELFCHLISWCYTQKDLINSYCSIIVNPGENKQLIKYYKNYGFEKEYNKQYFKINITEFLNSCVKNY